MTLTAQLTAAAAVPLSAIAGGRIGGIIATATNPDWIGPLLGPLGALAGTLLAIRWLLARLDKSEARHEARDAERERNMQTLIALTVQNQEVINQNSIVLREVKSTITKP